MAKRLKQMAFLVTIVQTSQAMVWLRLDETRPQASISAINSNDLYRRVNLISVAMSPAVERSRRKLIQTPVLLLLARLSLGRERQSIKREDPKDLGRSGSILALEKVLLQAARAR